MLHRPDRRVAVRSAAITSGPLRVPHPCRCDAPDPEATRFEPLAVPVGPLLAQGQCLVICPECDYHLLVTLADPHASIETT